MNDYGLLERFRNGSNPVFASDHFDAILDVTKRLISQGDAYFDKSTSDEIKTQRHELTASPYRNTTVEENMAMWDDFVAGKLPNVVCRLKISYNTPNA